MDDWMNGWKKGWMDEKRRMNGWMDDCLKAGMNG